MITLELMEELFPTKGLTSPKNLQKFNLIRERVLLVRVLNKILPKYGINTFLRLCAFLANCGIETDYFRTTEEYAGGSAYEGRKDLGNTQKGDGRRFKGRDLTQTTGRFNYFRALIRFVKKLTGKDYSKDYPMAMSEATRLGVNFIEHPELLAQVEFAVESACVFWDEHNLNDYADRGEFRALSGIVNRGDKTKMPLHWSKRSALYERCKAVVPKDISFQPVLSLAGSQSSAIEPTPAANTLTADLTLTEPATAEPQSADQNQPSGFAVSNVNWDTVQSKYEQVADKCRQPAVQNVFKRAGLKMGGGLVTVWSTTGGKIALVLTGLVVLGVLAGITYSYRNQIRIGYEMVKESFFNFFKMTA